MAMSTALKSVSFLALAAVTLVGCDDPAPQKAAPSATVTVAAVATSAAPVVSAAPAKPKKKRKTAADCGDGPVVKFDDEKTEAAVRLKLQKPKGDVTRRELAKLTSLNLSQVETDQVDPCIVPYAKNLKELFLGPGGIDDLSPIAELTKLETLRASISKVSDIKPLEKLEKLDRLDLGRTQVRDLTPLAGLVNLTELALDDTPVTDLGPLAKLEKLERLSLQRTRVRDLSPLKGLTNLKFLYVQDSPAADNTAVLAPLRKNGLKIFEL
jgi:internalin A